MRGPRSPAARACWILDPLDPRVGGQIQTCADSHGVPVIDYDRLGPGGSRSYYVSFDNELVGKEIGQGLVDCATAWHLQNPRVLVMYGDPADHNATQFGQGYDAVLAPLFSTGTWTSVGKARGTWYPPAALAGFQQQFQAHPDINAALTPNDFNAAPIISYLRQQGVRARTFPITGQDATLMGLQSILVGYQCGTAYKPIYLEAEAAAALAIYLRADATPPASLVNQTVTDPTSNAGVPAVLLPPTWVTAANMASTVIADKFVSASELCAAEYQAACTAAGISG